MYSFNRIVLTVFSLLLISCGTATAQTSRCTKTATLSVPGSVVGESFFAKEFPAAIAGGTGSISLNASVLTAGSLTFQVCVNQAPAIVAPVVTPPVVTPPVITPPVVTPPVTSPTPSTAQTWYVRPDGGTRYSANRMTAGLSAQCDGTSRCTLPRNGQQSAMRVQRLSLHVGRSSLVWRYAVGHGWWGYGYYRTKSEWLARRV